MMSSITYLWLFLIMLSVPVSVKSKYMFRRSANALVRPQMLPSQNKIYTNNGLIKKVRSKDKCKVMPLKARSHIKADTIFIGTVVGFYNKYHRHNARQEDVSYLKKGNISKRSIY